VCSPGKELHFNFDLGSYMGKVYYDGQAVRLSNGEFLRTQKHSMTITKIRFGQESQKQIAKEIAKGARNEAWDRPEGAAVWADLKAKRKAALAVPYDGTSPRFGFARVIPLNPGCKPVSAGSGGGLATGTQAPQTAQPQVEVPQPEKPYVPQENTQVMAAGVGEAPTPW
jgi:hypothetical protein